jgi:hypothetical protein
VPIADNPGGSISLNSDHQHENWYLEIVPYGTYARCAIYCVDENTESNGSQLNFHVFNTKLISVDHHKTIEYKKHMLRKIGRNEINSEEYVDVSHIENGVQVELKDQFTGSLQHFTLKGHVADA